MTNRLVRPLVALTLMLTISVVAFADTIRLKDGSVIRGQVVGFKDQQFVVLVGAGSRGRRSQITLYMEDVESIEFDSAGSGPVLTDNSSGQSSRPIASTPTTRPPVQRPAPSQNTQPDVDTTASGNQQPSTQTSPVFIQVFNSRVRGDNTGNGWTYTGFSVRRGQRIRITARGSVMLGGGRVSTPVGLTGVQDTGKLMPSYPTGALIAVIGDDNDDFIHVGGRREFIAQRDGGLFLGVNEGNLNDNTGGYEVSVEVEATGGTR